ncbi:MAG: beta-galactosidase [Abditibacteriota bacterium]|nr:beta-galactosidase [Abditibacteriota bacterium]
MRVVIVILFLIFALSGCAGKGAADSASSGGGELIGYNKLSQDAIQHGYLHSYEGVRTVSGTLAAGGYKVRYTVPSRVRAYDMVPVNYTLEMPAGSRRTAFEAVAFEDPKRTGKKATYDMAIPGDMRVKMEYLGSVSADYDPDSYPYMQTDPKAAPPVTRAPIKRDRLVRSGIIRAADCVWFKFRLTNTGNTILDPEGFGAGLFMPWIMQVDDEGNDMWQDQCRPINLMERHLDYIYPGESFEFWTQFDCSGPFGWPGRQLREGNYVITMDYGYRINKTYDYWCNVWGAMPFQTLKVYLRAEKEPRQAPVKTETLKPDTSEKMPDYVSSFEEFMTSFDYYRASDEARKIQKTMYLQVAPWTECITLRLMLTDPQKIAFVRIPVTTETEHLKIAYNPDNTLVVNDNGLEVPIIAAQAMPGMRMNFQLGPYAEERMLKEALEMKEMGVNVISNTAAHYWNGELTHYRENKTIEPLMVGYRYWFDHCMQKAGLKSLGWSVYPGLNGFALEIHNLLKGTDYTSDGTYNDEHIPEGIATLVKFCYDRWGDNWVTDKKGRMPIEMEDSWGWMRYDVNDRFEKIAPDADALFREWARKKYGSIEAVNKAWGSGYKGFEEIKPSVFLQDAIDNNRNPEWKSGDPVFYDWSPAMEDLDTFRTEQRMAFLDRCNREIRKYLPNAELSVRTEGANLIAKGDPQGKDSDLRHIYYSQRRQALKYDTIREKNVLHFFTDYTTIAYTPTVFRQACREAREAGVATWYLMQFDHMRDIVLNDTYGNDYSVHYNLPEDAPHKKGMMMHVLAAAYPYWRIAYEEGHAAGILWADYLCDGFATETQKKEIRVLRDHLPVRKAGK